MKKVLKRNLFSLSSQKPLYTYVRVEYEHVQVTSPTNLDHFQGELVLPSFFLSYQIRESKIPNTCFG